MALCEAAARRFEALGCEVELVEDALGEDPVEIWMAEFYSGIGTKLKDLMTVRPEELDPAVVTTLSGGLDRSMVDYFGQLFARYEFREKMRQLFDRYDLLLSPTLPCAAFDVGHDTPPGLEARNIVSWVYYTYPFNLTGQPAASIPSGFTKAGLPVGLQMVAGINREVDILRAAAAFEEAAPWADRRPPPGLACTAGPPDSAQRRRRRCRWMTRFAKRSTPSSPATPASIRIAAGTSARASARGPRSSTSTSPTPGPGPAIASPAMTWTSSIIPGVQRLLEAARAKRIPIVYTTTAFCSRFDMGAFPLKKPFEDLMLGSPATEIDDRVALEEGVDTLIVKKRPSAFAGTHLGGILRAGGIDTLICTGVTMASCVRHTVEDALGEGFRTVLVRECVGDRVPAAIEWNLFDLDMKYCDVEPLERVLAYLADLEPFEER